MRPRTTVVLLEPVMNTDGYSDEPVADWKRPATEHPDIPAAVDPLSSTEAVLTAGTVISRWVFYQDATTTPWPGATWRIRWDGDDYDIASDVVHQEGSLGGGYLSCVLQRVTG